LPCRFLVKHCLLSRHRRRLEIQLNPAGNFPASFIPAIIFSELRDAPPEFKGLRIFFFRESIFGKTLGKFFRKICNCSMRWQAGCV
jgi:hypothetical protein